MDGRRYLWEVGSKTGGRWTLKIVGGRGDGRFVVDPVRIKHYDIRVNKTRR